MFAALAHEARRHIVLLLGQLGGQLPSGYLAARFQHSWPTTTRHLKVLEQAGIVTVQREGRGSNYRLERERLRQVVGGWLGHIEPMGPEQTWTSAGPKSTAVLVDASAPPFGGAARSGKAGPSERSRKPARNRKGQSR